MNRTFAEDGLANRGQALYLMVSQAIDSGYSMEMMMYDAEYQASAQVTMWTDILAINVALEALIGAVNGAAVDVIVTLYHCSPCDDDDDDVNAYAFDDLPEFVF